MIANGPTARQNNHVQGPSELASQGDTLQMALGLLSRALGLENNSALTMESLQVFASELRAEDNSDPPVPPRYQLIHRVAQDIGHSMYLDVPQWIEGAESRRDALVGKLPVLDIPNYLSKHPEVCCVIYRDYNVSQLRQEDLEKEDPKKKHSTEEDPNDPGIPRHHRETIEPATEDLFIAIESFLKHHGFNLQVNDASEPTKLSAPYVVVYHTRDVLEKFLETLEGEQQRQFHVLLNYVYSRYAEEYKLVDDMTSKGKIFYAHIQYLFKPGDVLVKGHGQDARGYLNRSWLEGYVKSRKALNGSSLSIKVNTRTLQCWNWTFDGMFSREQTDLNLTFDLADEMEKSIDNLDVRPLKYTGAATASRLQQRGEWIWKCRVRCMVSYEEDPSAGFHSSHEERYMIDMMMYRELHDEEHRNLYKKDPTRKAFATVDELGPEILEQDSPPDNKFIYLLPTTINGYNLKRKKWLELKVDRIRQVVWNKRAFDRLEINRKTKRLIQALISNQIETERSTDLISGKGNGLILLLHGGPGTGKTLTAESVAEIAEKPLYPVTCGDIGTEPEVVEDYLETVLHIGKTWGCVVLLDEADVFLEQRSLEDLRRNALVSVFLRVLEYYDGILVLTSNRVGTFDEAFKSRIQLAIHYKNLDLDQRTKIWGNFIDRLEELGEEGVDFNDLRDNIQKLASNQMNGREIRNTITTARQSARWERKQPNQKNYKLDYKLMNDVLQTAGEFDQYIKDVHDGLSHDEIMAAEGLRVAGRS